MIGLVCALAVCAAPEAEDTRWPRSSEWYLVGETRKLSRVSGLDEKANMVTVHGDDGKAVTLKFDPSRYILLDDEPQVLTSLLCGREAPEGVGREASTAPGVAHWRIEFGEIVHPVRGRDGRFDGKSVKVGADTFVLVWKWDRERRSRSAGWIRAAAICPTPADPVAGRKFEDELAPGRAAPLFFPGGLSPTLSLEKYADNKDGVRVPTKAVIKRTRPAGDAENFRVPCFRAPGGAQLPGTLKVLQHYYVFGATRTEDVEWYLVGGGDYLKVRHPEHGPNDSLLGWVRAENVLLWGTGQSIEFDPVTRPRRAFLAPDRKRLLGLGEIHRNFDSLSDRYSGRKNIVPAAFEIPEVFNSALSRMPILEQRTLKVQVGREERSYTAYKVAYVGHNLILPPRDREELLKLRTRLDQVSTLDILLVVDVTANSGVHRDALRSSVRDAWERIAEQTREAERKAASGSVPFRLRVRVGVLAYRTPGDLEFELQPFDFTDDRATFDGWWAADPKAPGPRLEFSGGVNDDPHVSSVRKALGIALRTSVADGGRVDVEIPIPVDPDNPKPRPKRPVRLNWAPGSQRVILVLGDVGQKEGADDGWSRDRLAAEWGKLDNRPYLVGVQVGTHDWFEYPNPKIKAAAESGYERFRTDWLALAQQINKLGGPPVADFVHLTQPGDAARRKELAETFNKVWAGAVFERTRQAHGELAGALKRKLDDLARKLGPIPVDLGDAARLGNDPLVVYDEGWVVERVPFPDAPGFNEKQVRACVLIDETELGSIRDLLTSFSDQIARSRTQAAKETGANAVARALARNLAEIDAPVKAQFKDLAGRHPALHVIYGILRYTPEQFAALEDSEVYRWEAAINQSLVTVRIHLDARDDRGKWAEVGGKLVTWLPLSVFPDEQGQFPLTRRQTVQLRDQVLLPLHRAMLEARAGEDAGEGKEMAGQRLSRWAQSEEGKTVTTVLNGPEFEQARVGVLGMTPAQFASLRRADVDRWHQNVYRALDDCEAVLRDKKAWVTYRGVETTWYPVAKLPNSDNVTPADERKLQNAYDDYSRARKLKE